MSANHTYVSSEELFRDAEEMHRLSTGNIEEMRRAEAEARREIEKMRSRGRRMLESLGAESRKAVSSLQAEEERLVSAINTVEENAQSAENRTNDLKAAVVAALDNVDQMLDDLKTADKTAMELYQEARRQYAMTQSDTMYMRFAQDQMDSIRIRLEQMGIAGVAQDAMQIMSMTVLTDIYHMDVEVARKKAEYNVMFAQAIELGNRLRACCKNLREGNREDLEDSSSKLLDMDFWTDGRFAQMEAEIEQIMARMERSYDDPGYTAEDLRKDYARLEELMQMKDILAVSSRKEYNKSQLRKVQALTCMDILEECHHFTIVGHGFDMNDEREAYVVRMRRHTDNAEIEIIVNHGSKDEEFEVYFRVDSSTYHDEAVMADLRGQIQKDFHEAGISMVEYSGCTAEALEPFTPGKICISQRARSYHGMTRRQVPSYV